MTLGLVGPCLTLVTAAALAGCGSRGFLSQTASLGGDTAGGRGTVQVLFINNTPYRAIFTAGVYDPLDQATQPDFVQFSADPAVGQLEGDATSEAVTLACARTFSVGGAELIALIRANRPDADVDEAAMAAGVGFSSAGAGEADGDQPTEGKARPASFLIGADFPCNALLIVRLEIDDTGDSPFRVDFSYIPSESSR